MFIFRLFIVCSNKIREGLNEEGHNRRGLKKSKGSKMDPREKKNKGKVQPGERMGFLQGLLEKCNDERGVRHEKR